MNKGIMGKIMLLFLFGVKPFKRTKKKKINK